MNYPLYQDDLPYLTADQMREVDRAMIEDYHIELIQMMENAGRSLAHLARDRFLDGDPRGKAVIVLAGTGGNGGGALVAARRLHNYGAAVTVVVTRSPSEFTRVPGHQLTILKHMKAAIQIAGLDANTAAPDLILDGVIGYSLQGAPRGTAADLIRWANASGTPILALDVPSGVDTTSGTIYDPAIQAAATMTLALPKEGLRAGRVRPYVGELYLADISVPPALYASEKLGLTVGLVFAQGDIVRLW